MVETRKSILVAVRDQAKLLLSDNLRTTSGPRAWSQEQWFEAFRFLLLSEDSTGSPRHDPGQQHHDDMLFLTWKGEIAAQRQETVFVRRKTHGLAPELQLSGRDFHLVDWARSLLLNLVLQSRYQLTVVACGQEALPFVAEGRTWSADIKTVTKQVYASPTRTAVNLDDSRGDAAQPEPCYPNICFAVDNFNDAFEDLVLSHEGDCYCVVLHALLEDNSGSTPMQEPQGYPDLETLANRLGSKSGHLSPQKPSGVTSPQVPASAPAAAARSGDEAWQAVDLGPSTSATASPKAVPGEALSRRLQQQLAVGTTQSSRTSSLGSNDTWHIATRKKTLFAGYVSHGQIATFLSSSKQQSFMDKLRGVQVQQRNRDKVVMSGPEGVGRAEVAVTKMGTSEPAPDPVGLSSKDSSAPGMGSRPASFRAGADSARVQTPSPVPPPSGTGSNGAAGGGPLAERASSLLGRARAAVKQVADNVSKAVAEQGEEGRAEQPQRMQCALMQLMMPADKLTTTYLDAL